MGGEWQPIETAPLDGRLLLLFDELVYLGVWLDDEWMVDPCQNINLSTTPKVLNPTHWMRVDPPTP